MSIQQVERPAPGINLNWVCFYCSPFLIIQTELGSEGEIKWKLITFSKGFSCFVKCIYLLTVYLLTRSLHFLHLEVACDVIKPPPKSSVELFSHQDAGQSRAHDLLKTKWTLICGVHLDLGKTMFSYKLGQYFWINRSTLWSGFVLSSSINYK